MTIHDPEAAARKAVADLHEKCKPRIPTYDECADAISAALHPKFDPVKFYRDFPGGGSDWLMRCLTAMIEASQSETPPKGQHLAIDLQNAFGFIEKLAAVISATHPDAFKGWARGENAPYELAKEAVAFVYQPRSVSTPSATPCSQDTARLDFVEKNPRAVHFAIGYRGSKDVWVVDRQHSRVIPCDTLREAIDKAIEDAEYE